MCCYTLGRYEYEFVSTRGGGQVEFLSEGKNLVFIHTVFHLISVGIPVNLNCGCFLNSFSGFFHLK